MAILAPPPSETRPERHCQTALFLQYYSAQYNCHLEKKWDISLGPRDISQDHRDKTRFMLLYYSYSRPLREARGSHCHTSLEHQLPPHPLLFHHRELVSSVSRTPSHAAAAHAAARRCRTPPPHADAARRHPPSPPPPRCRPRKCRSSSRAYVCRQ